MTKRFTLRAATIGLAMSTLLVLAACGGDDDSADTTAAATTEQTTAPAEQTTATTAGGGADTTGAGASTTTSGGGTVSADCRALAQEFASALGAGTNPTADPAEIGEAFARLADNVPADLKDDVELVGEALGKYAEVYAKVGGDPTKAATDPDVLAAFQELATPEYTAATKAVSDYFASTCQTGG